MTLFIDNRAGSKPFATMRELKAISELARLDSADVMLNGHGPDGPLLIGVEIKSILDFVNAASTGRLQGTQIPAMREMYDVSWLLIYGPFRPSSAAPYWLEVGSKWHTWMIGSKATPYSFVAQLLRTIEEIGGVRIARVNTKHEAAVWLLNLHAWWSKEWASHHGMRTFDKSDKITSTMSRKPGSAKKSALMPSMDSPVLLRANFAKEIPGLGYERALAAAKHFKAGIGAMFEATEEEWMEVEGIGKGLAKVAVATLGQGRVRGA